LTEGEERVVGLLEELVTWTRFANRKAFIDSIDAELKDDKQLLAFELTDGRSQKQVGDAAGLSQPTISGLWRRWRRLGIVREIPGGRVRHIARPTNMGMERAERLIASQPKLKKESDGADSVA